MNIIIQLTIIFLLAILVTGQAYQGVLLKDRNTIELMKINAIQKCVPKRKTIPAKKGFQI